MNVGQTPATLYSHDGLSPRNMKGSNALPFMTYYCPPIDVAHLHQDHDAPLSIPLDHDSLELSHSSSHQHRLPNC